MSKGHMLADVVAIIGKGLLCGGGVLVKALWNSDWEQKPNTSVQQTIGVDSDPVSWAL